MIITVTLLIMAEFMVEIRRMPCVDPYPVSERNGYGK